MPDLIAGLSKVKNKEWCYQNNLMRVVSHMMNPFGRILLLFAFIFLHLLWRNKNEINER